jgi:Fe-S-cluster containining protein
MAAESAIIARYATLADYCSAFWNRVAITLPGQIACRKGCSICCELPSVNYLEARIIADYCAEHPEALAKKGSARPRASGQDGSCPFITDGACRIYKVRPVICRTHGLLLRGESFREPVTISCPYNFREIDHYSVGTALVLDIEKISDNLARLNAAYCLARGDVKKTSERIRLCDLAEGPAGAPRLNPPEAGKAGKRLVDGFAA